MLQRTTVFSAGFVLALAACHVGDVEDDVASTGEVPTFEEFEASTYLEPWEGGVYIVNGDTPIVNVKQLRELYDFLYGGETLIVHRAGGADAKWNDTMKRQLTYCVSDSFGSRKAQAVAAMQTAAGMWEAAADVDFHYVPAQDGACTASNGAVVFDVRPTSGASYLARAFFPNQTRSSRNVIVDTSAFTSGWPVANVLAHELGHAIGFRHEHTRPEAGQCFEDSSWRALTPYDSASIMHYPQCGGTGQALTMSTRDRQGAAALYGAPADSGDPGGDPPPPPPPTPPPPSSGTPRTGSASGSLARGQSIAYQPLSVLAGSRLDVAITGTGDADLYVRFGAQPTASLWDCRPYLNGSAEQCSLDVPAGQSQAYLLVYGYTAASYQLTASWVQP
jgi:hypothetical protein